MLEVLRIFALAVLFTVQIVITLYVFHLLNLPSTMGDRVDDEGKKLIREVYKLDVKDSDRFMSAYNPSKVMSVGKVYKRVRPSVVLNGKYLYRRSLL